MINQLPDTSCPSPRAGNGPCVTLAHGEGGRLMRRLLQERVFSVLKSAAAHGDADAARLPKLAGQIVFTTDSYVVSPLVFPGGDIGKLAVFGTANDLAVSGARARWISLALIIEEGFSFDRLDRILVSVASAALEAGVSIVTGDTKVVPRGTADGLFLNTAGIGELLTPAFDGPSQLREGDELIVSGPIGRHGVAVMVAREQMDVHPLPESDCALLTPAVDALRRSALPVVALRDATRGGVAAVLHEWAAACGLALAIQELRVPITAEVRGICELLGLDPLHVANEGTMVIAVREGFGEKAVEALRTAAVSREASLIGRVQAKSVSPVVVERGLGRGVPLDEPAGAPLPRIC